MTDRPKDRRDKALLLLGFAGGFRRSELVGIDVSHIEHVPQGVVINLPRSKTDQEARGRKIGIPLGRTRWCPVQHLNNWLEIISPCAGPLFRRVDRAGKPLGRRLSAEAVSIILKQRASDTGFDPEGLSGHSLRSGFVTSAVTAGVSTIAIRRTTGHASEATLSRYVRIADIFQDNAANMLL